MFGPFWLVSLPPSYKSPFWQHLPTLSRKNRTRNTVRFNDTTTKPIGTKRNAEIPILLQKDETVISYQEDETTTWGKTLMFLVLWVFTWPEICMGIQIMRKSGKGWFEDVQYQTFLQAL